MDSSLMILHAIFDINVTIMCLNINDIAIITVRNVDYCCITYNIRKSETINLLDNPVFEDRGYI